MQSKDKTIREGLKYMRGGGGYHQLAYISYTGNG